VFPTSYRVRHLTIAPNLVLAPMEGVTDLLFRRVIRRVGGVGLTCTEFIAGEALRRGVQKAELMARIDPDERPVAIQIYGRDPAAMADAARLVEELGADICDLNFGCPSKKVCAHSGGSALLKDPALAREIVAAVRAAIRIPLTVKMRSGFDADARNAPEIAWMCQEEGAEAITVHWRTRADQYGGVRAVDKIAETKTRLSIPVIGNGDVIDWPSARAMLAETGCDGVMIGRGAIRNPWIFRQIEAQMAGRPAVEPSFADRRELLVSWYHDMRGEFRTDRGALGRFKKIANHFTHGLPYGSELRVAILRAQEPEDALARVDAFFAWLEEGRATA
jgi:nifR3 family TIM-barrel protein